MYTTFDYHQGGVCEKETMTSVIGHLYYSRVKSKSSTRTYPQCRSSSRDTEEPDQPLRMRGYRRI
jgi:hypothetical protein